MTKRSGYSIKISAFIEADPKDMKSMKDAADLVDAAHEHLHFTGFKMVKLDSRFMLSREVPDAAAKPVDVKAEFGKAMVEVGAPMLTKAMDNALVGELPMPPIPAVLDRRSKP